MEHYTGRRINVRAIIYKDGKLLAVKHKHGDNISHYYAVPGGGLDPQESLIDKFTHSELFNTVAGVLKVNVGEVVRVFDGKEEF